MDSNFAIERPSNGDIIHDLTPAFQFLMRHDVGDVKYRIIVSTNHDFTSAVEYSQITNSVSPRFLNHYDGAEGDTTFTDSSPLHLPITNFFGVYKNQATKVFGLSSGRFPSGRYLYTPYNTNLNFGASTPFTIETRARGQSFHTTENHTLYQYASAGPHGIYINLAAGTPYLQPQLLIYDTGVLKVNITASAYSANNTWRHIAVTRDTDTNKTIRFFVDGNLIGSANGNFNFNPVAGTAAYFKSNSGVVLWMDETRILNGVCRWTSNFTPPAYAYENSGAPIGVVSEWDQSSQNSGERVIFVPPYSRKLSNAHYYWKVLAYPSDYSDYILATSDIYQFTISEASYKWMVGLSGSEIEFIPSKNTVTTDIQKFGRTNIEKRKFTVKFMDMDTVQRNLLYNEFARRTVLKFHDNMGGVYNVYWGEVERTMNGTAYQPSQPKFGIDRSNLIAGALRWNGTSTFSEV